MIKFVNKDDILWQKYIASAIYNPFSTRIKSLYAAYGTYPKLCDFWYQTSDNKKITSTISKYGGKIIAYITDTSDLPELSDFIKAVYGSVLLCDNKYTLSINCDKITGSVMECSVLKKYDCTKRVISDVLLNEYYSLLNESMNYMPDFESFYTDLNHKIRHNVNKIWGITDGKLLSACTAVAMDNSTAVLGGVAVLPEYRGMGYGSNLVYQAVSALLADKKYVYLYREQNKNKNFYSRLGFTDIGQWAEYKFK